MSTDTKEENEQVTIENVSKFLAEIKKLPVKKGYELIYRGVDKLENALPEKDIPSIFRKPKHIKNEDKMFHELVARTPDDFDKCRNTFEHLVVMQHYKLPTRLLDVIYNPLIALYFACTEENNNKENGRVIIYRNKVDKICNYNSDRVTCLANLSKASFKIGIIPFLLNFIVSQYQNFLTTMQLVASAYHSDANTLSGEKLEKYEYDYCKEQFEIYNTKIFNKESNDIFEFILEELSLCDKKIHLIRPINKFFEYKEDFTKKRFKFQSGDLINRKYFLQILPELLKFMIYSFSQNNHIFTSYRHNIINEKPAFNSDLIDYKDISSIYFVQPKQSHSRIIAQNGAFLIFGLGAQANNKSENPLIPNVTSKEKAPVQRLSTQLIIPQDKKAAILDELDTLNITKASLFPEIENVADVIKEKYKQ